MRMESACVQLCALESQERVVCPGLTIGSGVRCRGGAHLLGMMGGQMRGAALPFPFAKPLPGAVFFNSRYSGM